MSQKYEKLKTLLTELFQLDQPDLDFGLYRVMHTKSAEVSQFLDKDLLPQVKDAFALYQSADKAEIEKDLGKAIEQAQALGGDPETMQRVKDLRARIKSDAVDIGALESEVYDHLFSFFRRYYAEGDFLAKRVYKPGVYAIPYEGEEVTLHWANKDHYYIKTSEYLRDYAFRLRPDADKKPLRVHFRLVDAAEGEHGLLWRDDDPTPATKPARDDHATDAQARQVTARPGAPGHTRAPADEPAREGEDRPQAPAGHRATPDPQTRTTGHRREHAARAHDPEARHRPRRSRTTRTRDAVADVGLYRAVSYTDLSDQHFDGHPYATRRSVNHMIRAGLIEEHEATGPEGHTFKVLTATERGRDAAQRAAVDAGHVPEQQTWTGLRQARRAVP